jgi:enoyl-CoA hydratase
MLTTTTIDAGVAVVRLDDGKANAVSRALVAELHAALDRALADADSVCLVGREGRFSAGFDLSVMTAGAEAARSLVGAGAELIMRVYGHPQPTVAAVTGHALAAGVLLAAACDTRLGAAGVPAKLGLNEVAIGMHVPAFALALARERVVPRHFVQATLQATVYDMAGALEAGWLDALVPADELVPAAIAEARRLGGLGRRGYARTKSLSRSAVIADALAGLALDLATFEVRTPGEA